MSITLDPHAVLAWYRQHGRHDLPWQQNTTPYRVWVSEIMLQQTQVATVIPYYLRFMQHYPNVEALAAASQDEVLHLWTGLGYYARGRNLHKAAGIIVREHGGVFPDTQDQLAALPGIGRSTAGAILALGHGKRGVILDGNVKRVLCRFHAITEWSGTTATQRLLWKLADAATPAAEVAAYTQAIMDLGATVCRRGKPACHACPLQENCQALASGQAATLPVSKPRKVLPEKRAIMVMYVHDDAVLLQQRDSSGLWGGLWGLPELANEEALATWLRAHHTKLSERWPTLRHTFSHFHLDIQPVIVTRCPDSAAPASASMIAESEPGVLWHPLALLHSNRQTAATSSSAQEELEAQGELDISRPLPAEAESAAPRVGLAAPVKKLLSRLAIAQTGKRREPNARPTQHT